MHAVKSLLLLSVVFGAVFCVEEKIAKSLIVDTKYGKFEGSLAESELYYEFFGIRYGVPVRFRAPTKPPAHSDVYKADNTAVLCPQFPYFDPLAAPSENEDCLVLNIFTPIKDWNIKDKDIKDTIIKHGNIENTTLPVMVFLHGGGFGVGSASPEIYGPQFLVSHGVVVVTVNYRLNAYGFLNLGIKEAPGNAGLKDIRAALRWIKENIKNFNGNSDNITVFGQGSGGIAALYLMFSESTKGLFHKIISESGTQFSAEAFDIDPLGTASQVAKSLEVTSLNPDKLYNVYNDNSVAAVEEAISKQMHPTTVFLPSVENVFDDEEAFLIDTPYNILNNPDRKDFNPVPVIIGLNIIEGLVSILDYYTITSEIDRLKHGDYKVLDRRNFNVPTSDLEQFRKTLNHTYFSDLDTEEDIVGGFINLNTDFSFVGPISLFSEMYANNTIEPLFSYIFNYTGNRNLGSILTNSSLEATTHLDELFYILELERVPLPMDEEDARMVTFMTMMWTNFAKFGTPTPDPSDGDWLPYPFQLAIDLEPKYVSPITPDRALFWRGFYNKYGGDATKWRNN